MPQTAGFLSLPFPSVGELFSRVPNPGTPARWPDAPQPTGESWVQDRGESLPRGKCNVMGKAGLVREAALEGAGTQERPCL